MYKAIAPGGDTLILKITRPGDHDIAELRAGVDWLHRLHGLGPLNAIQPVPAQDGSLVVTVSNPAVPEPRHCVLFRWLPGVAFTHRLSVPNAWKWGALAAEIHDRSDTLAASNSVEVSFRDYAMLLNWNRVFYWDEEIMFQDPCRRFMPPDRRAVFQEAVHRVERALEGLYCGKEDRPGPMLIHGDLHPDNILVHRGSLYALDFEDVMWAYPVQDLAIALWYIARHPREAVLREAFRRGYESKRPWPERFPGEIEVFAMGRVLMLANFILHCEDADTEDSMAYYEREIRAYLQRLNRV